MTSRWLKFEGRVKQSLFLRLQWSWLCNRLIWREKCIDHVNNWSLVCANSGTLYSWCWEGCVGGRRVREWEEQGWREGEAPCLEALLCVPGVLSLEFLMEIRLSVLSVAVLKVLWHLLGDFVNFSETFAPFRRLLLPQLWGLVYTLGHRIRALQTVEQGTPRLRVFRRMTGCGFT